MKKYSLPQLLGVAAACATLVSADQCFASIVTYQDGTTTPFIGGIYTGVEDTMVLHNDFGIAGNNFGGRTDFAVGEQLSSSQLHPRRALLRFDVTSLAGQYASINSVTLRLTISSNASGAGAGSDVIQLFREAPANAGWVEGTQANGFELGSSSWNNRNESGTPWAGSVGSGTAGTDYLAPVLASVGFDDTTSTGITLDFVFNDVSFLPTWISGSNAGLLMRLPDDSLANIDRALFFDSSEAGTVANRPQLIIDYTAAPEPSALALIVLMGATTLLRRPRSNSR